MNKSNLSEKHNASNVFNLTLVAVISQVGCLTLLIVMAALFSGLWLDNRFQTRPTFTLGLLLTSIPVTLVTIIYVVRKATSKIENISKLPKGQREEIRSGKREQT